MPTLSFYDYAFLLTETADSPKHVAGVQIFRPPAGYAGDYVSDLIETLKERPVGSPFDFKLKGSLLSKPEWVRDDNFDLDYHLRRSRLPRPGSRHQLMELVGRLHSILLDRQRPLWEIHVIDGLEDGCFALYVKIHHSYCDGATLVRLLIETLNTSADDRRIRAHWEATHSATFSDEARDPGSTVDRGVGLFRRTVETVTDLSGLVGRMTMQRLGLQPGHLPVPFTAPKTRLNSVVTRARRAAVGELPLDELKAISKATDTTLNDVVVTICDIALTRYLRRHHQTPKGPLVAQMPVSLRRDGNAQMGNQLAILPVTLGRAGQDPVRRLKAISRSAAEVKEDAAAMSPDAVSIYTLAMQGAAQAGELLGVAESLPPLGNILISNVPGPRVPLYLWGAKMVSAYPLSAIPPGLSMNITVFSYDGKFDIGLIAGYDAVPDIEALPQFVEEAFDALRSATQRHLLRSRKTRTKVRRRKTQAAKKRKTVSQNKKLSKPPGKTLARKKELIATKKKSSARKSRKRSSATGANGASSKKRARSATKPKDAPARSKSGGARPAATS
ncbi:MAG: wax ester/triacylglycerol synthase family O-acyltransferase [Gammaproteobacteria bacterium]|nr:MAG: wax ester/triacylglycerol synthase family O-acyltransferase [Gammaproteobacteria bacterium]